MLNSEIVVLDFEGFRHKKTGFIIKEISICSNNYSDTILFLPPVPYNHFPLVRGNLISGLVGSYMVYLGALVFILTGFYPKSLSQLNFVSIRKGLCKRKREIGITANPIAEGSCRFEQSYAPKLKKFFIRLNILLVLCTLSTYPRNNRKNIALKEKHSCISIR